MSRVAIGLCFVVVLAALSDGWLAVRPPRARVPADVMQVAKQRLLAIRKPGDQLVHSPLLTVAELAPLGELDIRPDRPTAFAQARRRTLALDFATWPMFGLGGTPVFEEAVGAGLVIRAYAPEGDEPGARWSLIDTIGPQTMVVLRSTGGGERRRACDRARPEGGFECPGEPEWLYAAPRELRIEGRKRTCVWAHPTTGGTIVLNVPGLSAERPGVGLSLRLGAGLADDAVRLTPDGAAVMTEIVQGDRTLGRLTVANRIGWFTHTVALAPGQAVELRITTARDGRRHHCVQAEVIEAQP